MTVELRTTSATVAGTSGVSEDRVLLRPGLVAIARATTNWNLFGVGPYEQVLAAIAGAIEPLDRPSLQDVERAVMAAHEAVYAIQQGDAGQHHVVRGEVLCVFPAEGGLGWVQAGGGELLRARRGAAELVVPACSIFHSDPKADPQFASLLRWQLGARRTTAVELRSGVVEVSKGDALIAISCGAEGLGDNAGVVAANGPNANALARAFAERSPLRGACVAVCEIVR